MLDLKEIEKYYSENLFPFKRNLLREYLQYKILQLIFNSNYACKLSFLGGTALRIIHDSHRFSEDLDFDNFNLKEGEFHHLATTIRKGLELEGYRVEIRSVFKGAYRCYLKFPRLLFDYKLSGYEEEKILVQIDTSPHHFSYSPDKIFINKFDVFTEIFVTPIDILLSQKIAAIFGRKSSKGRDFYDVVFLLSRTKPNYDYLQEKIGVSNSTVLREKLLARCASLNFKLLTKDVLPFLMNPKDSKMIASFTEYIKSANL